VPSFEEVMLRSDVEAEVLGIVGTDEAEDVGTTFDVVLGALEYVG